MARAGRRRTPPPGERGAGTGQPGRPAPGRGCAGSRGGPGVGTRGNHRGRGDGNGRGDESDEHRVAAGNTGPLRAVGAVAVLAGGLLEPLVTPACRAVLDVLVGAHPDLVHSRITPRGTTALFTWLRPTGHRGGGAAAGSRSGPGPPWRARTRNTSTAWRGRARAAAHLGDVFHPGGCVDEKSCRRWPVGSGLIVVHRRPLPPIPTGLTVPWVGRFSAHSPRRVASGRLCAVRGRSAIRAGGGDSCRPARGPHPVAQPAGADRAGPAVPDCPSVASRGRSQWRSTKNGATGRTDAPSARRVRTGRQRRSTDT